MSEGRSSIRGGRKEEKLGTIMGWAVRLLAMSLRKEVIRHGPGPETSEPRIFCFWHNRIVGASATARGMGATRDGVVLTSASKDGAILAAAMRVFGLGSIRGSSSRRGAAALVALKRALAEGKLVTVTPDGPRGPLYVVQAGLVKLASLSGAPITILHVEYADAWEMKTWDRFLVPKPFSKVRLVFAPELRIPPRLTEGELEAWRKRVELLMQEGFNSRDDDCD